MIELARHAQEKAEKALQELQVAHENLRVLASTDPLTGTMNRREFLDRANVEVARSKRSGAPLSLILSGYIPENEGFSETTPWLDVAMSDGLAMSPTTVS